jgi:acetylornithine deacetylase/succinyl-diaminopimelate desuccinylase-like protein
MADLTNEVTDLLRTTIRNACVNDGTPDSGNEVRNVDTLVSYLEGAGLDVERYEPHPGRGSVIARIEGRNPDAPSLMLMGHTDVVPVNPDGWERDPFGGELVDGVVWGRGAVDMLNTTTSMAVAFKHLAQSGFTPEGSLTFVAVADEEALGTWGAKYLTENETDAMRTDYVITELGGMRMPLSSGSGAKLVLSVAEKGTYWCKIRVRGTPGHGSMPYKSDNALVTAAEVVRRLSTYQPRTDLHEIWTGFVRAMSFEPDLEKMLLDADGLTAVIEGSEDLGLARMLHAATHTTFSPNMMHGGIKTNVIPDSVELEVDIRTLPGYASDDIRAQLREALGDLYDRVEIVASSDDPSSASPVGTPLWDTLADVSAKLVPGAIPVPFMIVGATDARFWRRIGATAYGYGLLSERIPFDEFARMFHGDNERVDQESLRLSTELWLATAESFLG